MDHLISFSESINNSFYYRISSDEWNEITEDEKILLTTDQIESISEILQLRSSSLKTKIFTNDNCIFSISALPDEWFIVAVAYSKSRTKLRTSTVYYKCDQFDGLIKCLNDINNFTTFK